MEIKHNTIGGFIFRVFFICGSKCTISGKTKQIKIQK